MGSPMTTTGASPDAPRPRARTGGKICCRAVTMDSTSAFLTGYIFTTAVWLAPEASSSCSAIFRSWSTFADGPVRTIALLPASAETVTASGAGPRPRTGEPPAATCDRTCAMSGARACLRTTNSVRAVAVSTSSLASRALTLARLAALAMTMRELEAGSATTETRSSGATRWPRWGAKASDRAAAMARASAWATARRVRATSPAGPAASIFATSWRISAKVASSARTRMVRLSRSASMVTAAWAPPRRRAAAYTRWSIRATFAASA